MSCPIAAFTEKILRAVQIIPLRVAECGSGRLYEGSSIEPMLQVLMSRIGIANLIRILLTVVPSGPFLRRSYL